MDRLKSIGVAFGAVSIMCIAFGVSASALLHYPMAFGIAVIVLGFGSVGWAVYAADYEERTKNTRAQVEEKRAQNNTLDSGIEKTRGE